MKMDSPETLSQRAVKEASATEVFVQVGTITRLLHDTMQQLGVMPKLQVAADGDAPAHALSALFELRGSADAGCGSSVSHQVEVRPSSAKRNCSRTAAASDWPVSRSTMSPSRM